MNHIMLDIETLDTEPTAVVLSIGAVAFDPQGDSLVGAPAFYVEANDLKFQQDMGRTVSAETVKWWMQQNVLAKRVFSESPDPAILRLSTIDMLISFDAFILANGGDKALIWGNGSDFDNIIVGSLYTDFEMKRPWTYNRNRCFRTMKALVPNIKADRQGVYHNALDDAISQAGHLQLIMRSLLNERAA